MNTLTEYINALSTKIEAKQKNFFAEEDKCARQALKAELELLRNIQVELELVSFNSMRSMPLLVLPS